MKSEGIKIAPHTFRQLLRFYARTALFLVVTVTLAPSYFFLLLIFYPWRRRLGPRLVQFYSRICLLIFRVAVCQVGNYRPPGKKKGTLIISNHTSFLDIFALSALFGAAFVSKAEVRYYPIIGQIAWLMGVIFFDRGSPRERLKVLNTIVNRCPERGLVVFPQGTTSRITERLSFNRGIFKAAELNPDIMLLPVTLHYREDREIAWNKPQTLKENAMQVGVQEEIHLTVLVHDPVTLKDYRGKTAAQICKAVERTILGALREEC